MMLKRGFDVVASFLLILATLPALIVTAIAVKLDSHGPILYRGVRVGLNGRLFLEFKFRTMTTDAESLGGSVTSDDDPRITRVGRYLRKLKIDEIPQLINVLKGDMSLVGPRPEVPTYVARYSPEEKQILTLRPGLTDWASLWDHDEGAMLAGVADPEKYYLEHILPKKLTLQMQYLRDHSMMVDLYILVRTVLVVLRILPPPRFS